MEVTCMLKLIQMDNWEMKVKILLMSQKKKKKKQNAEISLGQVKNGTS